MATTVLYTGFPGFLGSALLPRTLRRSPDAQAVALVQERWLDQARGTLERLESAEPAIARRTRLVVGDITRPGLGLDDEETARLRGGPLEIFHLAAVYDLSVAPELAWAVNVEGTRNVVDLARGADELVRLQYVSTCYVSGRYPGIFAEDDLELGQSFSNHYEHTKHEAERVVAKARDAGMPVTIYRPSVVVGDSRTGETQKYDGPYYALQLIARQGRVAVMPLPGDPARVQFNLVPSDFVVDAIAALAPHAGAVNRTVALAAPRPPSVLEMCEAFAAHTDKRLKVVPVPTTLSRFSIDHLPGVGRLFKLPSSTLDYLTHPTVYDVTATTALLDEVGVRCPSFAEHVGAMVAFHREHPDVGSAAMV
ncbi:SDR family oxidoreductase [Actinomycetospora straminea]|uniref:SDR family oxidoreductase n=1 Tax=Actinomycetospora straminea TaxID=663607 RepID=A0ABP9EDL9_9PSEU|nr:SDR family oxidoreductase [Actinomycetospora straminea]MDD7932134.1 SDR family oxidoreductase [Actinomycetospora straminea]